MNVANKYTLISRNSETEHSLLERNAQLELWEYTQNLLKGAQDKHRLEHCLLQLRKLREALTSSRCTDAFALQVYQLSLDLSIRTENHPELTKTLHGLAYDLFPAQATDESAEWPRYLSYYLLYTTLVKFACKESPRSVYDFYLHDVPEPWKRHADVRLAMDVCVNLNFCFNYHQFWLLYQRSQGDGRRVLDMFVPEIRIRIGVVLRKSYYSLHKLDCVLLLGLSRQLGGSGEKVSNGEEEAKAEVEADGVKETDINETDAMETKDLIALLDIPEDQVEGDVIYFKRRRK